MLAVRPDFHASQDVSVIVHNFFGTGEPSSNEIHVTNGIQIPQRLRLWWGVAVLNTVGVV